MLRGAVFLLLVCKNDWKKGNTNVKMLNGVGN